MNIQTLLTFFSISFLFTFHHPVFSQVTKVNEFPGTKSQWHSFARYDFEFEGRASIIVAPEHPAPGTPWIWRARFFGHEPQTDIALLKKGFHVAYTDVADWFGAPVAVAHWNRFYEYLTVNYGFSNKVALEGMSRGGLIIYNWAAVNTDKVSCIYADAPVCDINSWPGGKGKADGDAQSWEKCLQAYHLSEAEALNYENIPIYNCVKIAAAGIPALHVCGAADVVVPMDENSFLLEKNFKAAGGNITVIVKEGIGHHPHSLKDPRPIVDFILQHTAPKLLAPSLTDDAFREITHRGSLQNSFGKFEHEKTGRVAFLGGSITNMQGWRDQVCNYLRERFPDTRFDFINAGIPSTGSVPGAFRLTRDVFKNGPVDLLFEEAAVNDATNFRTSAAQVRGMEGIIRHARQLNPDIDIVMMHFADQDKMVDYNQGKVPEVIQNHEKVAAYYQITSINLAKEVNNRILDGQFTWKDDFKDLHPSPFGQNLYFESIKATLEQEWAANKATAPSAYSMSETPLDPHAYYHGKLIPVEKTQQHKDFHYISRWVPQDSASTRSGFTEVPVLEAIKSGAVLKYSFKGNAIGIFIPSGPDAGIIRYHIDKGEWQELDLFTPWSSWLHIPWLYILADGLTEGKHTLTLELTDQHNVQSKGTACRIIYFAVNSTP